MNLTPRMQQFAYYVVWTVILLVVSRIGFDLLAWRPWFWSSREGIESLLFNTLIGGPFILFALMVAAQRQSSGK